jgi:3',5'-cyclic AMP phosphodiesterase CpdA
VVVLAHVSDFHLDGGERAAARASAVMAFLDTLVRPVDAMLLTGDVADHGLATEYEEARALLDRDYPVLTCPGNHDVRASFRQSLLGQPPSDDPVNAELLANYPQVAAVLCGHAHTPAATTFAGRPLLVAPGVVSTLRLPWESDEDIDESMPPAIAFHVLDDDRRLTTHYRLVT